MKRPRSYDHSPELPALAAVGIGGNKMEQKLSMSNIRVEKILKLAEHIVTVAKKLQESPLSVEQTSQAMGAIDDCALHMAETIDDHRTGRPTSQYVGVYYAGRSRGNESK
jgi:hypothetical protein